MKSEVLLVSPPFWDMYSPPASLPALTGHLTENGVGASQIDLNQLYFIQEYDSVINNALEDFSTQQLFDERIPHEHKEILGLREYQNSPFESHELSDAKWDFSTHRQNIKSKPLSYLSKQDAVLHYGYFIRNLDIAKSLMHNKEHLKDNIWNSLEYLLKERCLSLIERDNTLIVGFSLQGEQQIPAAIACSAWLKRQFNGIIIWGGSAIADVVDASMADDAWWRLLPDLLCYGEGETSLLTLARRCRSAANEFGPNWKQHIKFSSNPSDPDHILGLVVPSEIENDYPETRFESIKELAAYNYNGIDLDSYLMPWRSTPYQASRGCHWGMCSFCDHHEGYRHHYRPHSIERVVNHLELFSREHGIQHIHFVDEAMEPRWLEAFNIEIERRNLSGFFRWSQYSKISSRLSQDLLARSRHNGCRMMLFGVETFDSRILRHIKKGILRRQIFENLSAVQEVGLSSWIWLISGMPSQTPEELRKDIRDLQSLEGIIDAASVNRYRISKNSDIYREAEAFGILSYDLNNPADIVSQHNGVRIAPEEMERIYRQEYYPMTTKLSRTHNRYLLFADALRREKDAPEYIPQLKKSVEQIPVLIK